MKKQATNNNLGLRHNAVYIKIKLIDYCNSLRLTFIYLHLPLMNHCLCKRNIPLQKKVNNTNLEL